MESAEYDRMFAAEERHWWYAGLHDLVLRFARAEAAHRGRPLAMLDAGCGTGRLAQLLQPLGEVTGCDIHPRALALAAERGIARLVQCDLGAGLPDEGKYDLITAIDVLYHRRVGDEGAALRHLHRALLPGGCLLLQVPAFECLRGTHDIAVHTRRRYRPDEIAAQLRSAGFRVEFLTCRLLPFFVPMLLWRIASRSWHAEGAAAAPASDVASGPGPILNRLLLALVKLENRLLATRVPLPIGSSVFVVARCP